MPFGDRTGPEGKGPKSGRGAGYCAGTDVLDNAAPRGRGFGRGRGEGRGLGRGGWRRKSLAAPGVTSSEQEVSALRAQVQNLQEALQRINDRLSKSEE